MALPPLLLLAALAAVVALATSAVRRSPPSREATVAAARRHGGLTSAAALVLGLAGAAWLALSEGIGSSAPDSLGRRAVLVPLTFGAVHTVGVLLGELTWPRPAGQVRRARLVHRGLLDPAPSWLARTALGAVVLAGVTIVVGALAADPSGRGLTRRRGAGVGMVEHTAGPFPGWFYGEPATWGLALLAVLTVGALWVVATRPAVVTDDERVDAVLRRASAHRVLRGATAATLVVAGGLLMTAGGAAWSVTSEPSPGLASGLAVVVGGLGFGCAVAALVVLCTPAPRVPVDEAVAA